MIDKIFITIIIFVAFVIAFRKAGGTLSPVRLNTISFSFYILLLTSLIGGTVIYLGFRNHYVIYNLSEEIAQKGFYILAYTVIALPCFIVLFNKLQKINNYHTFFQNYIDEKVDTNNIHEGTAYSFAAIMTLVCFFSVMYTFYHVGYIALIKIFAGNFELFSKSVSINRQFTGNVYIRNILAIGLTPILSYYTYIYSYYTGKKRWKTLFYVLFILSILIKTYDFSKAPVIIYLFYFYLIKVIIGDIKNIKKLVKMGIICVTIILLVYYIALGYTGKLFTFSSGPLSRMFISQIAGLFMHVQIFPSKHSYLDGASFPHFISWLFNVKEYGIRSGRVVMEVMYPSSIADNSVGVMNCIFVAEAYANYGLIGVVISPIVVAFCISVIPNFIIKQRKNPTTITLYILVTYCYQQALIGGFVDFIYNVVLAFIFVLFIVIQFIMQKGKIYIRF